jgi:hypothetical protein
MQPTEPDRIAVTPIENVITGLDPVTHLLRKNF